MKRLRKAFPLAFIVGAQLYFLAQGAMLGCSFSNTLPTVADDMDDPNAHLCACRCGTTIHEVIKVRASGDDAEQVQRADDTDAAGDLDLGVVGVGIRFANLAIPPTATIESAVVQFTADQAFAGDNTTPLTIDIFGEAAANAASFGGNFASSIGTRARTTAKATWMVPPWAIVQDGNDQQTPDLKAIVQEVVGLSGWRQGNALVLLFTTAAGRREAESFDGFADHAPVIEIAYRVALDQAIDVCMPTELNPNLTDHEPLGFPSDDDLADDCAERVQTTLSNLAMACKYPAPCTCTSEEGSRHFNAVCNDPCVEMPLDPSCGNFDPENGMTTATHTGDDEPVCVTERVPIVGPPPAGIAAAMFGMASECRVTTGQATLEIGDETKITPAHGSIEILGTPCPGEECTVGLAMNLMLDPIEFEIRYHSDPRFENLTASSASPVDAALIGPSGFGVLAEETTQSSLRGERPILIELLTRTLAIVGTNPDPVGVFVNWEDHVCALFGNATAVVDDEGEQQLLAEVTMQGTIVNEPPHADAGPDQLIECTSTDGARVLVDGSASSDPEDNAVYFAWSEDTGAGAPLGQGLVVELSQAVGTSRTAVLRVIDAFGQADEDEATIAVQDTTAPELSLSVSPSILSPVNHKLIPIIVSITTSDACDDDVTIRLVSISSNEGDLADGSGHTSPDIRRARFGTDDRKFLLRAERSGIGGGRIYTITYEAEDASGNVATATTTVTVPKSQR